MIPTWQTCPECRRDFLGSDVVGDPCPECSGLGKIDMETLNTALNQLYYQEEEKNDRQSTS